jgi:hypothetical protein
VLLGVVWKVGQAAWRRLVKAKNARSTMTELSGTEC